MEASDILQTLWPGCARDAMGSVLLDIAAHHPAVAHAGSYDFCLGKHADTVS